MKNSEDPTASSLENISFQLLLELQYALVNTIESLRGSSAAGLREFYLFHSSEYINLTAVGFIPLRKLGLVEASKFHVRPAIETTFRQQAVLNQPDLLYRIANEERLDEGKWMRPVYARYGKNYDTLDKQHWQEFGREYAKQYPQFERKETQLKLREIAKAAKLEGYYDSHYRLYCKFTHGSFRAMTRGLSFSDSEDNRTMALCVLGALVALGKGLGADVPELAKLHQRVVDLPKDAPMAFPMDER